MKETTMTNKEKVTRAVTLIRTVGMPVALIVLNIAAFFLPKPWDDVASRALLSVVALWLAPLAGAAMVDWLFLIVDIKKSQVDGERLSAAIAEYDVKIKRYFAWRYRIIEATTSLRVALIEQGMPAKARELEPLIAEFMSEIDFAETPTAPAPATAAKTTASPSAN